MSATTHPSGNFFGCLTYTDRDELAAAALHEAMGFMFDFKSEGREDHRAKCREYALSVLAAVEAFDAREASP